MVVKWEFLDPTDSSTGQFEINPSEGGSPPYSKNMTGQSTVAAGGKTIIFEGAFNVPEISFSGTILSESQYGDMVHWFNLKHPIQVTDDLGRVFQIYITKFEPKRVRAQSYPWKHTYSCTAILMDWDVVVLD